MGGCTRAGGAHRHCKPQVAFSMFVVAEALPDRPHRCALQDSSAEGSGPVARRASCAAASTMKMIIVPEPTWRRGFSAEQMKISFVCWKIRYRIMSFFVLTRGSHVVGFWP